MNTIQAIQTHYNGYHFRSRLEARWAVFFDTLGLKYEYEKEGYKNELNGIMYLPDFWLPETECYVEVKGNMTENEAEKLSEFLSDGCPLPLFDDSTNTKTGELLILGDLPNAPFGYVFHKCLSRSKGATLLRPFYFGSEGPHLVDDKSISWINRFHDGNLLGSDYGSAGYFNASELNPEPIVIPAKKAWVEVMDAYAAGRKARFEHGQTPIPTASAAPPAKPKPGLAAFDDLIDAAPEENAASKP